MVRRANRSRKGRSVRVKNPKSKRGKFSTKALKPVLSAIPKLIKPPKFPHKLPAQLRTSFVVAQEVPLTLTANTPASVLITNSAIAALVKEYLAGSTAPFTFDIESIMIWGDSRDLTFLLTDTQFGLVDSDAGRAYNDVARLGIHYPINLRPVYGSTIATTTNMVSVQVNSEVALAAGNCNVLWIAKGAVWTSSTAKPGPTLTVNNFAARLSRYAEDLKSPVAYFQKPYPNIDQEMRRLNVRPQSSASSIVTISENCQDQNCPARAVSHRH